MARNKPVVGPIPRKDQKTPVTTKPKGLRCWAFSFRFWRQIEFFGLDKAQPSWFVSLLERLTELSGLSVDEFRSDYSAKSYHRYHEIDWNQKNIPIARSDLHWIDRDYLDNPDEYPLAQFMISKALGRVVGFWDENDVFNIVLLDPLHNIQPSQIHNYRVDPCSPLSCQYTSLLFDLSGAKNQECISPECPVYAALQRIPSLDHRSDVIIAKVEEGTGELVHSLLASNRVESVNEIIEAGIISFDA